MKSAFAVETAVEAGATPIAETDFEGGASRWRAGVPADPRGVADSRDVVEQGIADQGL